MNPLDPKESKEVMADRKAPESLDLKSPPKPKGVLSELITQAHNTLGDLTRLNARLLSKKFESISQAEASMAEVKDLQVTYTSALNELSSIRKRVAGDLAELRSQAARQRKEKK